MEMNRIDCLIYLVDIVDISSTLRNMLKFGGCNKDTSDEPSEMEGITMIMFYTRNYIVDAQCYR